MNSDRMKGVLKQLRAIFRRADVEQSMDEELAFHIEMETRFLVQSGMNVEEARRAALLSFHGVDRTKELVREARWTRGIEETVADARHAVRSLRRSPTFTFIGLLTLALGIGANGALFALLNGLLYRAPGGIDVANVVRIDGQGQGPMHEISVPDYNDVRDATSPAIKLAAFLKAGVGVAAGNGDAVRANAQLVTASYFPVLRVQPVRGRIFSAAESTPGGATAVAIISSAMSHRLYVRDANAVGAVMRVNGKPFTVIGVAPPGFVGSDLESPADVWFPLAAQPLAMPRGYDVMGSRDGREALVLGRLTTGTSLPRAQAVLDAAVAALPRIRPDAPRKLRLQAAAMKGWVSGSSLGSLRTELIAGWVLTGLLLLIVCANIANLLLSRSAVRQRELGVRAALGARRSRLIRFLTTEALVLSLGAIPLALWIAYATASVFQRAFLTGLAPLDVSVDAHMLLFSIAAAILCALTFGMVPALRFSRPDVLGILKGGDGGGLHRTRTHRAFVVAQVAFSVVLLLAGALFLRRLIDTQRTDPGFDADHVLVASFDMYTRGYKPAQASAVFADMRRNVASIPGVTSVSGPTFAPFTRGGMAAEVTPAKNVTTPKFIAPAMGTAPAYFEAVGIPLLHGRYPTEADDAPDAHVAVVSASFARRMWNTENAIGRTFVFDDRDTAVTVIGVVKDTRTYQLTGDIEPHFYMPYEHALHLAESNLVVRTAGDPSKTLRAVRRAIHNADPDLAVYDLHTIRQTIDDRMSVTRGFTTLIAAFGIIALLLSGIGLYGIVAFSVVGRTREIGVRIALGARPTGVVLGFVREGVVLSAIGLLIGGVFAFAFGKVLASVVDGIHATDPVAAAAVAVTLLCVTALASAVPALRAGKVDAMTSLRAE